jgi:hypothetical protein
MSLRDPQRNRMLPPGVQKLLNAMFASAETGMSGPEILGFFRARCNTIDPYPWGMKWIPSGWLIFEDCLAQFPLDRQMAIIQSLIEHEGPMKYGVPHPSDVQRVREWLLNDVLAGGKIDRVCVTTNGLLISVAGDINFRLAGTTHVEFPLDWG